MAVEYKFVTQMAVEYKFVTKMAVEYKLDCKWVFGTSLIYHAKFRENMRMKNLQNIPAFTKHGQTLEYYQSN